MAVHVHLLPSLFEPEDLSGGVAVMIDVLRASSTICTALDNGAEAVVPLLDPEEALRRAASEGGLSGGERGGEPIEGFDFGNSPSSYGPAAVRGRTVFFTTTNGTRALGRMRNAEEVFVGGFVNRDAVTDRLRGEARDVHLVCAGTDGHVTAEDVLFAGAVASDLLDVVRPQDPLGTQLATHLYFGTPDLDEAVRAGLGGRNLIRLGLSADIDDALSENTTAVLPRLDGERLVAG